MTNPTREEVMAWLRETSLDMKFCAEFTNRQSCYKQKMKLAQAAIIMLEGEEVEIKYRDYITSRGLFFKFGACPKCQHAENTRRYNKHCGGCGSKITWRSDDK